MATTVLIVDGEEGLLALMQTTLMKEGYRVITSHSGHEALNLARVEKPDLILFEFGTADMDGFEFMRQHSTDGWTPIILLAAAAGTDDRVRGLELGADDFISKPFGLRELTLRVQAVLRRAGRATAKDKGLQPAGVVSGQQNRVVLA